MSKDKNDRPGDWINVYVTPELKTQFRVECAKVGVPMSAKATQLIEAWVRRQEKKG